MLERDFAVRLHNAELVAHVITHAVKIDRVKLTAACEVEHRVGEIDFAALRVGGGLFNQIENFGRHNHTAQNRIAGHNLVRRGLFDDVVDLHDFVFERGDVERAVFRHVFARHFLYADNAAAVFFISAAKLTDNRVFRDDNVVAVHNRERLVADEALGAKHRVTETFGLFLADIIDVGKIGAGFDAFQNFRLCRVAFELGFELKRVVKVVFNDTFAAVGDNQNVGDTGGNRFLDDILNCGFVHNVQHFFRNGFGRGQNPGAQARCGNNGFCDFHNDAPYKINIEQ